LRSAPDLQLPERNPGCSRPSTAVRLPLDHIRRVDLDAGPLLGHRSPSAADPEVVGPLAQFVADRVAEDDEVVRLRDRLDVLLGLVVLDGEDRGADFDTVLAESSSGRRESAGLSRLPQASGATSEGGRS
jgi:hypothetical protein